jgi:hypothetical protein
MSALSIFDTGTTILYGGGTVSDLAVSGLMAQEGMAVLNQQQKQHQANFIAQQKHSDKTKSDQQKRDDAAKRDLKSMFLAQQKRDDVN